MPGAASPSQLTITPCSVEQRLVEVDAIVGGERSAANERKLHEALRRRAAALAPTLLNSSDLFQSFWIGGVEGSTHRTPGGRRLDLGRATAHDRHAEADYLAVAEHGMRTVRDGLRWHLIETAPGQYDWSSWLPMLRASQRAGTQVIWSPTGAGRTILISGHRPSLTDSLPS